MVVAGPAQARPGALKRLLRAAAFAAVALYVVAVTTSDSHGKYTGLAGGNSTGKAQQPAGRLDSHQHSSWREMCTWSSSQAPSAYEELEAKGEYPTTYEDMVSDGKNLTGVHCPVCGATQQSVHFDGKNLREEGLCPTCQSFNRFRQIGVVVLAEVLRMTGKSFGSIKELSESGLDIYNTQCSGAMHTVLHDAPGYVCSEYFSADTPAGSLVDGVRHEDLQHTSFKNNKFDLIISSEVFEHIPCPYQAHAELLRILRPGGSHVFTAPFAVSDLHDQVCASIEGGKLVHHINPPIFHDDPIHAEGVLVFTIFGKETVDKMCMLGFDVTTHHLHDGSKGILGNNAFVFVATKTDA